VVFVLDRSGSMGGWKIVAARRALARMIDTLRDADRFCVMAFDNTVETPPSLPNGLTSATDRHRFRTVEYLSAVNARGGTEMAGPLDQAVKLLTAGRVDGRDRVLVLITDGQVGNENQVLQTLGKRLKGIRVFTLGIDRAVNEGFLRRLAELGGGSCDLVESEDRLDEVMTAIHRRIGTPLLTGLSWISDDLAIEPGEIVPRRLPDLFTGSPLLILGRYRGRPAGTLTIRAADAAGRAWSEPVPAQLRDNPAIAAAWARGQVRQLEDRYAIGEGDRNLLEKTIVAVSLKFQVLCRFTAYVAIDRSQVVNEGGSLHHITQPVEQPEGWDFECNTTASLGIMPAPAMAQGAPRSRKGFARSHGLVLRRDVRREDVSASAIPSISHGERTVFDDMTAMESLGVYTPPAPTSSTNLPDRFLIHEVPGYVGGSQRILIKPIPPDGLPRSAIHGWEQELEIVASLGHPALPRVDFVGQSGGWLWITIHGLTGRSVSEHLRVAGRITPLKAAALVAELAEALQLTHEKGLHLGTIDPRGILVGDDGRPRLLGFGAARIGGSGPGDVQDLDCLVFLSPEQVRDGGPGEPRGDVYSLGVLLYELVTGHRPFAGDTAVELLSQIVNDQPIPPRRIVRSIPADLEVVCLKAMAKKPDERYQSAGELAGALRDFLKPRRRAFWK
jgi:hypothetical protein